MKKKTEKHICFSKKYIKHIVSHLFSRKGTLTLTPGMGKGRGGEQNQQSQNNPQEIIIEYIYFFFLWIYILLLSIICEFYIFCIIWRLKESGQQVRFRFWVPCTTAHRFLSAGECCIPSVVDAMCLDMVVRVLLISWNHYQMRVAKVNKCLNN